MWEEVLNPFISKQYEKYKYVYTNPIVMKSLWGQWCLEEEGKTDNYPLLFYIPPYFLKLLS